MNLPPSPAFPPLALAMESNSSKNNTQGAAERAYNRTRHYKIQFKNNMKIWLRKLPGNGTGPVPGIGTESQKQIKCYSQLLR